MSECHCAMMWEVLLDQDMAVKSAHLRDSEDTDLTEDGLPPEEPHPGLHKLSDGYPRCSVNGRT